MKKLLASRSSIWISFLLLGSPQLQAGELTITIKDIVEQEGGIMIAVLSSEQQFNEKAPPVASMILHPSGDTTSFTLHDVTPGSYGIRVMHDINGNAKMETNLVGMPKEPWGFSNNATGKFGPPKWKAVKFEVEAHTEAVINLNR